MRRRAAALLASFGLALSLAATGVAPAHADSPCTITNFSPRTVVVGLTPVVKTFGVSTTGCDRQGWSVLGGDYDFYVYDDSPQETFSPYDNSQAGPRHVTVEAYNSDYVDRTRVFPASNGFSLKRRTVWSEGTFDASPEPARRGSAISIKGRLKVVDWSNDRLGYGGRLISVEFRTTTGSYTQIKTATTSSDGWLGTTVPAKTSGRWRIRYGGNTIAGGAVAAGDYVKVS